VLWRLDLTLERIEVAEKQVPISLEPYCIVFIYGYYSRVEDFDLESFFFALIVRERAVMVMAGQV
jgi:hypothetical protein